jgi:hypothetical protein
MLKEPDSLINRDLPELGSRFRHGLVVGFALAVLAVVIEDEAQKAGAQQ